jgi:hypothetical protein
MAENQSNPGHKLAHIRIHPSFLRGETHESKLRHSDPPARGGYASTEEGPELAHYRHRGVSCNVLLLRGGWWSRLLAILQWR